MLSNLNFYEETYCDNKVDNPDNDKEIYETMFLYLTSKLQPWLQNIQVITNHNMCRGNKYRKLIKGHCESLFLYKNTYLLLLYVQPAYFSCKTLTNIGYLINLSYKILFSEKDNFLYITFKETLLWWQYREKKNSNQIKMSLLTKCKDKIIYNL